MAMALAPKQVTPVVAIPVVIVKRHIVAAIKHPRPGAKYSANNGRAIAMKDSSKG